jgi:hypothetical protein
VSHQRVKTSDEATTAKQHHAVGSFILAVLLLLLEYLHNPAVVETIDLVQFLYKFDSRAHSNPSLLAQLKGLR